MRAVCSSHSFVAFDSASRPHLSSRCKLNDSRSSVEGARQPLLQGTHMAVGPAATLTELLRPPPTAMISTCLRTAVTVTRMLLRALVP